MADSSVCLGPRFFVRRTRDRLRLKNEARAARAMLAPSHVLLIKAAAVEKLSVSCLHSDRIHLTIINSSCPQLLREECIMNRGNLSRRGFLGQHARRTDGGRLAALVRQGNRRSTPRKKSPRRRRSAPMTASSWAPSAPAPIAPAGGNSRPARRTRRRHHAERHAPRTACSMVAVCDVDRPNAEFAAEPRAQRQRRAAAGIAPIFADFRRLLERSRHQRRHHRHAGPLARPDRHRRHARPARTSIAKSR